MATSHRQHYHNSFNRRIEENIGQYTGRKSIILRNRREYRKVHWKGKHNTSKQT
jgi:hypothetical protein